VNGKWIVIVALVLFMPALALSEYLMPITFEGRIGDFAAKSRIYEIEGQMFQLGPDTIVEDKNGARLPLQTLQGGTRVRVHGQKVIGSYRQHPLRITRIVVLDRSN